MVSNDFILPNKTLQRTDDSIHVDYVSMNKIEKTIITLALAITCPLLTFVAFWWSSAAIAIFATTVPVKAIIAAAFTGLFIGVLGDILFLKRWVEAFYTAKWACLVAVYLMLSVPALALCMGIPIGNLVLGTIAGLYVGRRHLHAASESQVFVRASRKVGLFTGIVVAAVALPVGILALYAGEEEIARSALEAIGLSYSKMAGLGFVAVLCGLLLLMQYGLARSAARLAHRSDSAMRAPMPPLDSI